MLSSNRLATSSLIFISNLRQLLLVQRCYHIWTFFYLVALYLNIIFLLASTEILLLSVSLLVTMVCGVYSIVAVYRLQNIPCFTCTVSIFTMVVCFFFKSKKQSIVTRVTEALTFLRAPQSLNKYYSDTCKLDTFLSTYTNFGNLFL